jgi:hypothetical protein
MTYEEWEVQVAPAIKGGPVWKFYGYRKSLFLCPHRHRNQPPTRLRAQPLILFAVRHSLFAICRLSIDRGKSEHINNRSIIKTSWK